MTTSRRQLTQLVLTAAILVLLSIAVEAPYMTVGHWYDDQTHLELLGVYLGGEIGLLTYLLTPHNEHVLPLFRAWYLVLWRLFGLNPVGWHLAISCGHALGALALLVILRRYLRSAAAAALGAAIWALHAVGGWDNPLLWIASSHLASATSWLLLAMAAMTRVHGPSRWPTVVMALALFASILMMGSFVLVAPVLIFQYIVLERRPDEPLLPPRRLRVAWAIPVVFGVALQVAPRVLQLQSTMAPTAHMLPLEGLRRLPLLLVMSLASLLGVPVDSWTLPSLAHPLVLVPAAIVATAVALLDRRRWRCVALVAAPGLLFAILTMVSRSAWPQAIVLSWGRYRYLPTLSWCVLLSAMCDQVIVIARPWPRWRRLCLLLLFALYASVYVPAQVHLAVAAARHLETEGSRLYRDDIRQLQGLLRHLSARYRQTGHALVVPDIAVEMAGGFSHRLRHFCAFALPGEIDGIAFVPIESVTLTDRVRLDVALSESRLAAALRIQALLSHPPGDATRN